MPRVLKLNIYPVQHAKWFRRIMRMAGVRLCFTELASPRQNSPIERLFGTLKTSLRGYAISGKAGLHTSELLKKRQLDGCLWASAVGLPNLPVHTAPENDTSDLMTSLR